MTNYLVRRDFQKTKLLTMSSHNMTKINHPLTNLCVPRFMGGSIQGTRLQKSILTSSRTFFRFLRTMGSWQRIVQSLPKMGIFLSYTGLGTRWLKMARPSCFWCMGCLRRPRTSWWMARSPRHFWWRSRGMMYGVATIGAQSMAESISASMLIKTKNIGISVSQRWEISTLRLR